MLVSSGPRTGAPGHIGFSYFLRRSACRWLRTFFQNQFIRVHIEGTCWQSGQQLKCYMPLVKARSMPRGLHRELHRIEREQGNRIRTPFVQHANPFRGRKGSIARAQAEPHVLCAGSGARRHAEALMGARLSRACWYNESIMLNVACFTT